MDLRQSIEDNTSVNGEVHEMARRSSLWTYTLPRTLHVDFFRGTDWAASPLGPLETWTPLLRFAVTMLFNDNRGAAVYWGRELTAVYNESFIAMAAAAHPILMGNSFWVGFPSAWDDIKSHFDMAYDGVCAEFPKIELMLKRDHDYLEEAYFYGHMIPIKNEKGEVEGVYNTGFENTVQVLYERRKALLNKVAAIPSVPLGELYSLITEALETNGRDIPMCLIYSTDEGRMPGKCFVELQSSIGVPSGHRSAPMDAVVGESSEGFISLFQEVRERQKPLVLADKDGSLLPRVGHLLDGIEWRGWGERCRDLSIVPLLNSSQLIGFMVIASNPRRTYDDTCAQFVTDLAQHIAVKWGSAITLDNMRKREERLIRDLEATEKRIRHMAQYAPVGMVQLTPEGRVEWANDQWYEITAHPRDQQSYRSWVEVYTDSSQAEALRQWDNLLKGEHTATELQVRRLFTPPAKDDIDHHVWVTALGFPFIEDGKIKFIMGTLTDVSHLKWAESVQARSALQASEAKSQQEEFIDMTSHEMRNPLSAMYQCASMIATSLDAPVEDLDTLLHISRENVEAANTILTCATHQKRIIDDVLILNRLENMMLSITPIAIKPPDLIRQVVKIFHRETTTENIDLQTHRHSSFDRLSVDLVCCDPSRLTQIFINLISNAIKFTRDRERPRVTVTFGASLQDPLEDTAEMTGEQLYWQPTSNKHKDLTTETAWGPGEPLYLLFSVQDTGLGLEVGEVQRLFNRFSQANAKTHIKYGGSGLGLYISRELAEKQGGRIGIASTLNAGTTIAFYIKARRGLPDTAANIKHGINGEHTPRDLREKNGGLGLALLSDQIASRPKYPEQDQPLMRGKISILLVEDNLVNQTVLRKQLQRAGYLVAVSNHGVEALSFLQKTSSWVANNNSSAIVVDVVLMDWEMPVMDGLTCSKKIRGLEREGKIERLPIIATTANARAEQIQTALDVGIDDVITKPFLVEELIAKIHKWTGRT